MNAFEIPAKSIFAVEPKRSYPQLDYYHRKMALGTHPRQLRRAGLDVVDQRFKSSRTPVTATPQ